MPPKKPTREDQDAGDLQAKIAILQEELQAARMIADQATSDRERELQEAKSAEAVAAEERHRARLATTAAAKAEGECQVLRVEAEKTKQEAAASQMQRNVSNVVTQWDSSIHLGN